jgi:hypothetical protein
VLGVSKSQVQRDQGVPNGTAKRQQAKRRRGGSVPNGTPPSAPLTPQQQRTAARRDRNADAEAKRKDRERRGVGPERGGSIRALAYPRDDGSFPIPQAQAGPGA